MLPLIGLAGAAKSGKDTVAGMLVADANCVSIAQADPMKQLARITFEFTDDQLWGESRELKEAVDSRFATISGWKRAMGMHHSAAANDWCKAVCPNGVDSALFRDRLTKWLADLQGEYYMKGGVSPRIVLQTLGTEFGRSIRQDLWSEMTIGTAKSLLSTPNLAYSRERGTYLSKVAIPTPDFVLISDVRFRNEVINIKAVGGMVIKIDAPTAAGSVGIVGHASEAEQKQIPNHWYDILLTNDKAAGLEALRVKVQELVAELRHVTVVP